MAGEQGKYYMSSLLKKLSSSSVSTVQKALISLTRTTKQLDKVAKFRQQGGIKLLLTFIQSSNKKTVDMSVSVLANCALDRESRIEITKQNGLLYLSNILNSVTETSILSRCARAFANLSLSETTAREVMKHDVISKLVHHLKETNDSQFKQNIIRALRIAGKCEGAVKVLVRCDAIQVIIGLLHESEDADVRLGCLQSLQELSRTGNRQIAESIQEYSAIEIVVKLTYSDDPKLRENAVLTLSNITRHASVRVSIGTIGGTEAFIHQIKNKMARNLVLASIEGLCMCCREAVNRNKVRLCGGLQVLMGVLDCEEYSQSHDRILGAFVCFCYDELALNCLLANDIIPLVIGLLKKIIFTQSPLSRRETALVNPNENLVRSTTNSMASSLMSPVTSSSVTSSSVTSQLTSSLVTPSSMTSPSVTSSSVTSSSVTSSLVTSSSVTSSSVTLSPPVVPSSMTSVISHCTIHSPATLTTMKSKLRCVLPTLEHPTHTLDVYQASALSPPPPSIISPNCSPDRCLSYMSPVSPDDVPSPMVYSPSGSEAEDDVMDEEDMHNQISLNTGSPKSPAEDSSTNIPLSGYCSVTSIAGEWDRHGDVIDDVVDDVTHDVTCDAVGDAIDGVSGDIANDGTHHITNDITVDMMADDVTHHIADEITQDVSDACAMKITNQSVQPPLVSSESTSYLHPHAFLPQENLFSADQPSPRQRKIHTKHKEASGHRPRPRQVRTTPISLPPEGMGRPPMTTPIIPPESVSVLPPLTSPTTPNSSPLPHSPFSSELQGLENKILFLLSRFGQMPHPSEALLTPRCIQTMLDYVSFSANPNPRCFRLLSRLMWDINCFETHVLNMVPGSIYRQLQCGFGPRYDLVPCSVESHNHEQQLMLSHTSTTPSHPTSSHTSTTPSHFASSHTSTTPSHFASSHTSTTSSHPTSSHTSTTLIHPTSSHTSTTLIHPKSSHTSTTLIHPSSSHTSTTPSHPTSSHTSTTFIHPTSSHTSTTLIHPTSSHTSTTLIHPKSSHTSTTLIHPSSSHTSTTPIYPTSSHTSTTPIYPTSSHTSTTPIHPTSSHTSTTPIYPTSSHTSTTPSHPTSSHTSTTLIHPTSSHTSTTPSHPTSSHTSTTPSHPISSHTSTTLIHPSSSHTSTTPIYPTSSHTSTTPSHPTSSHTSTTLIHPTSSHTSTTPSHPTSSHTSTTPSHPISSHTSTTLIHPSSSHTSTTPIYPTSSHTLTTPSRSNSSHTSTTPSYPKSVHPLCLESHNHDPGYTNVADTPTSDHPKPNSFLANSKTHPISSSKASALPKTVISTVDENRHHEQSNTNAADASTSDHLKPSTPLDGFSQTDFASSEPAAASSKKVTVSIGESCMEQQGIRENVVLNPGCTIINGQLLLSVLTKQACSSFGEGLLAHLLLRGSVKQKRACALSLPFLCRPMRLKRRLLLEYNGLLAILSVLSEPVDEDDVMRAVEALSYLISSSSMTLEKPCIDDLCFGNSVVAMPTNYGNTSANTCTSTPVSTPAHHSAVERRFASQKPVKDSKASSRIAQKDEVVLEVEREVCDHPAKRRKVEHCERSVGQCCYSSETVVLSCDVVFTLNDGQSIMAHRTVLSDISGVFSAMLSSDFVEANRMEVHLKDIEYNVMMFLVHYAYGCSWSFEPDCQSDDSFTFEPEEQSQKCSKPNNQSGWSFEPHGQSDDPFKPGTQSSRPVALQDKSRMPLESKEQSQKSSKPDNQPPWSFEPDGQRSCPFMVKCLSNRSLQSNYDFVTDLLVCADRFLVDNLKDQCAQALLLNVTPSRVTDMYLFGVCYSVPVLCDFCLKYVFLGNDNVKSLCCIHKNLKTLLESEEKQSVLAGLKSLALECISCETNKHSLYQ